MSERRYTEQEEALEIKSLRRTIAAYAKYVHHRPNPRSAPPLLPCWPVRIGPFIPAVDWKFISSGARSWKRFRVHAGPSRGLMGWPGIEKFQYLILDTLHILTLNS